MPTIALDCQIILDGHGYWIDPSSFSCNRPRIRQATHNRTAASAHLGVGERYVDHGPGKREWTFLVVGFQAIRGYDGSFVGVTGQSYRDALQTSYEKVNTILAFTDPTGAVWNVRFDHLVEGIHDVRAQADGQLQYFLHVSLVEA